MPKEINEMADDLASRYADLEDKEATLKNQLLATQVQLASLESATKRIERLRLENCQTPVETCLHCYVLRGVEVKMVPTPSDTDSDWFRCRECGHEKEVQP